MTNGLNRHNKLFNDFKAKQRIINELQQKYLLKEGEKYTFYPIINNYIIKYNKPFFPTSTNTQIYYEQPSININNINNINKSCNDNIIKYYDTAPQEDPYSLYNNRGINRLKKSFQENKKTYFGSIDENTMNNMYKKIQKFKSTNSTKGKKAKKSIDSFVNKKKLFNLCETRNNTFEKNINNNVINKYMKISKTKDPFSEKGKIIQKTNSIKTFFSNNSNLSKNNNKVFNNNSTIITRLRNENLNLKKEMNNILKINIPIEESNNFNYRIPSKKSFISKIDSNNNNYLNKSKDIKNNYANKINNRCNYGGLSLKYLIQDEKKKNKNKNNSKSKKSTNISKQKANKIIDSIFNSKNTTNSFAKMPTLNNTLMINTDDYIDLNENPNNIIVSTDNFNYCTIEDNPTIVSKKIKTESNYKKININNKFNKVNKQKSYDKDTLPNSQTITLTENQNKQNKKYYNKNTFNKNKTSNISKGQKENLAPLNQVRSYNSNDYTANKKNNNIIYQKNNTSNQNKTKYFKEKEVTIPLPITSYNKLYIPNKIKNGKRRIKHKIKDEQKQQKFIYIKNKNRHSNDLNNNTNKTIQKNIYNTENISRENRINKIMNNTTNDYKNTASVDELKNIFSLKSKNNKINNTNINTNNNVNPNNNKINSIFVKNHNYSYCVEGKNDDKTKFNNNKYNYTNFKIITNEINQYYSKNEKDKESNIKEEGNENSELSIQSISDSKVLEIANTYVDEHVDKSQVDGILTYKKNKGNVVNMINTK